MNSSEISSISPFLVLVNLVCVTNVYLINMAIDMVELGRWEAGLVCILGGVGVLVIYIKVCMEA